MEEQSKRKIPGIGKFAQQVIRSGMTNEEALHEVLSTFPNARTTMGCINWYRTRMRKRGENVPISCEVVANRRAFLTAETPNSPLERMA